MALNTPFYDEEDSVELAELFCSKIAFNVFDERLFVKLLEAFPVPGGVRATVRELATAVKSEDLRLLAKKLDLVTAEAVPGGREDPRGCAMWMALAFAASRVTAAGIIGRRRGKLYIRAGEKMLSLRSGKVRSVEDFFALTNEELADYFTDVFDKLMKNNNF